MESIFHAGFLFLHFRFGSSTHIDHRHTACQLRKAFLEFFAVVIAGGFFDLLADLMDSAEDVRFAAGTFHDGGVFFFNGDAFGSAEHIQRHIFQLDAQVFADHLAVGQDGDIFQHGFASVTETGRLDGSAVQDAAHLVDDQSCQCFAFHVFRDDEQGFAGLGNRLKDGEHIVQVADLLFVDQDVGIFEGADHVFGIGHEVGGEVTLVELHAFHDVQRGFDSLGFFHRDGAVVTDFIHGVGDDLTDPGIPVGGDGGDLCDLFVFADILFHFVQLGNDGFDRLIDPALQAHGVGTGSDVLQTLFEDGFCENGCGGGTVTGNIAGLGCDFADHLGAHVLERVGKFHFLRHAHTVLGDGGGTEFLVQNHISAPGTEGGFDGGGKLFDAGKKLASCFIIEKQLFSRHCIFLQILLLLC